MNKNKKVAGVKAKKGVIPTNVMVREERALIANVEKTLYSSSNPQIYGSNGEKALLNFLKKYLPSCFRITSGHCLTPSGAKSPQMDLILVDSRFPPIAINEDGTSLEMFHGLIGSVEVKKRVNKKEIYNFCSFADKITLMSEECFGPVNQNPWSFPIISAFAYRSTISLNTISRHFSKKGNQTKRVLDFTILRFPELRKGTHAEIGAFLWFERWETPYFALTDAPLSDFFYRLIQDAYYSIATRNISTDDLGFIISKYFYWNTTRVLPTELLT